MKTVLGFLPLPTFSNEDLTCDQVDIGQVDMNKFTGACAGIQKAQKKARSLASV
jgi:hypothetical protein